MSLSRYERYRIRMIFMCGFLAGVLCAIPLAFLIRAFIN